MGNVLSYTFAWIVFFSSTILPTALLYGVTMPFVGALVRYRANYVPKRGVQLSGEDESNSSPAQPESYLAMLKRVHRIEGWEGLYKGIMPSMISTFIVMVAIMILSVGYTVLPNGRVALPTQSGFVFWLLSFALNLIPVLLLIPFQILINRAITTPTKLSAFAPITALKTLLSHPELSQPAQLYLTPGLAISEILQALVYPTLSILMQFVPGLYISHRLPILLAALPVIALATILLTPLQVMSARLTLQRSGSDSSETMELPPAYGAEEVMEFRPTSEYAPYTGLWDCGRQMVREEGVKALFRAWWVTPGMIGFYAAVAMAQ
ncbi:mitochondrial carrier domain-containing protein [Favolaschia claudopus]|uniref:Mitochondrial carrier domain-containing protein n=1 Tax=Favolaschia claudopus TaxID=2862362 RepID=A0AAW0AED1_9AGAR